MILAPTTNYFLSDLEMAGLAAETELDRYVAGS
jgi:hypothetical protein